MASLNRLPRELLLHIYSFLTTHDHAQLSVVSKSIGALADTLIWTNIDLYTRDSDYILQRKVTSLFWMLYLVAKNDIGRANQVASHVRSMRAVLECMNHMPLLEGDKAAALDYTWNLFPLFTNLEKLELNCRWEPYQDNSGRGFDGSVPPLPLLRSAKLFGYLPANFVRYIVRSAPTLESLELGVLDEPLDRIERVFPNLDDDDFDIGSLGADEVAPRPLPLFTKNIEMPVFPRLKHLYLCKPSMCNPDHYGQDGDIPYSSRAEEASLSDWTRLLVAVQGTVETLFLEHRIVAEYIENDGLAERGFIEENTAGPAEDHFMERIVPLFEGNSFPQLRSVQMAGLLVSGKAIDRRRRLRKLFESGGVQCKFIYGTWCDFEGESGTTLWNPYPYPPEDDSNEEVED